MIEHQRCPSTVVATGAPCKGRVPTGKTYCRFHDPARRGEHILASQKGGRGRRKSGSAIHADPLSERAAAVDCTRPSGLLDYLNLTLQRAARMPVSEGSLRSIAAIANAVRGLQETADIAQRLDALEAAERTAL